MPLQRLAVVSDVHGNLTAYRAVLADIAARGITRILNLGDVVGKGPRGAACTALTRERCEATVRGNWEVVIAGDGELRSEGQAWWRQELSAEDRRWLFALPGSLDVRLSGRRVRALHASPVDEFTRVLRGHSEEEFTMMFAPTPFTGGGESADIVVYGDIHDPFLRSGREGTLVNVGSVGNQLDDPTPSYAILEGDPDGGTDAPFGIQFVRVPYDVEAEIELARALGMPEAGAWEIELRTGIYRGAHAALGLTPGAD
ncbi:metallophosphatase family protein [Brachybacterium avium]|uniref:Metallophosphatase family protein n=1 Tax=Brachybacterium avium TaxID=2017485 RepID=A0A220UEI6_9MICO|nr:metallophosphoesterase family protein [Brachybacterium avium]ASK66549.1 metallophosphatase family protein [Brachybacterium avium]